MDPSTYGWLIVLATLLVTVIVVLWILLPFAIFGLKGLVRELLHEQRTTNDLLRRFGNDKSVK